MAEIIQRVRPDILLLQEFDYDAAGAALREFQANYLGAFADGAAAHPLRILIFAESNTGVPSGFDLDHDGRIGGGGDALGFGEFPGQYGMVLLSRFPIDTRAVAHLPEVPVARHAGALLPDDPAIPPRTIGIRRRNSPFCRCPPRSLGLAGSHRQKTLHLLISHPTPPAFDGPEDRNGRRNHDEIRFWSDYLAPRAAAYLRDDQGHAGGLMGKAFVIMGDQNSDPLDGGSLHQAIETLLGDARIDASACRKAPARSKPARCRAARTPRSAGSAFRYRRLQRSRRRQPARRLSTAAKGLRVCGAGVFWPVQSDPVAKLVWGDGRRPARITGWCGSTSA